MSEQAFSFKDYSLTPVDLIPPDDSDDEDPNYRWLEYCRLASSIDRNDILAVVLEELDTPASPLYDLIDPALKDPHEPGRPRESVTVLAGIGTAVMQIVAQAVDDAVSLRMANAEKQGYQSDTVVWRCPMTEPELRLALQRCQSRVRRAFRALDTYQTKFARLAGSLPIAAAAELSARLDRIRTLLAGEEDRG
jgi:hypothetical protein